MENSMIEERSIEDLRSLRTKKLHNLRIEYAVKAIQGCDTFLEVGSGEGFCTRTIVNYLTKPFLKVKAFDIDPARVVVAKALWTDNGKISYEVSDACKPFPYKDSEFDAAVLLDIIEHVKDPSFVIKECVRVLRRGGILFLVVPCEGEPFTLHRFFHKRGWTLSEEFVGHIQQLTKKSVLKMLEDEGLKTVWARHSCHIIGQITDMIGYEIKRIAKIKIERGLNTIERIWFYIMRKSEHLFLRKLAYFESKIFSHIGFCSLDLNVCCRKD
jgi:SAM-dependent methyltransferase